MEKLFDETHESEARYYRTIWYGYFEGDLDVALQDTIVATVQNDLAQKQENPPTATHWVFYSGETNRDAVDASVRASFMVRYRDGEFVSNYNMSDFNFVIAFDSIMAFKENIDKKLNA
ncbi:hypothetical protein [Listeria rocourtiae]|uniref:hypothetical protein n=1 Tax=Listeria rocourtiae TaxID=647910 RepID=UPI003D2F5CDF